MTGYDRSWLIDESIKTLKRDLIVEAIIVSFVMHCIPVSLPFSAGAHPHAAHRCAGSVHPHVLPARQLQHHVAGRTGAGHRRA